MEVWRVILEAPAYEVSSHGRVRNAETLHVMSARKRSDGYRQVQLRIGQSKPLYRKVSRLVCEAFHGARPFPKAVAAHRDGTRDNDVPGNLYWTTHKQNHADREAHGRAPKGSRNGAHRLTENDVLRIREELRAGTPQVVIADMFNVVPSTVSHINTRKYWSHI